MCQMFSGCCVQHESNMNPMWIWSPWNSVNLFKVGERQLSWSAERMNWKIAWPGSFLKILSNVRSHTKNFQIRSQKSCYAAMPFFSLNPFFWCLIWIFDEFVVRLQSPENQDPQGLLKECLFPFFAVSPGLKCLAKVMLKVEREKSLQVANVASVFPVGHFRHFVVSVSLVRNCRIWGNRFVKFGT